MTQDNGIVTIMTKELEDVSFLDSSLDLSLASGSNTADHGGTIIVACCCCCCC